MLLIAGKFIILRTCNSLLRKLSKSCNTEYCGRVLMFLASVYPISERSSVNVNGKVNTGNVTIYADEKEFLAALDAESSKERMGESSTTVLGNSSSMGVVETKVDDITAMEEDGEEKETPVTPPVSTTGKPSILPSSSSSSSLNTKTTPSKVATMSQYEIYKSFWHLQTLLNTEVKKMDAELGLTINPTNFTVSQATVTPVGKPTPPVPGNNKSGAKSLATATTATVSSTPSTTVGDLVNGRTVAWSALITHIDIVLELFESKPFSASEITQAREKVKNSVTRCLRDHLEARNNWISQFRLDHERATNRNSNGMLVDTEHISQSNNAHEGHSANNNNAVEEEYMGCKYLTSPTLFELQLRDTTLRQEVLVQILLFLHNLRTRLTSVLDSAVAAATLHAATAPVLVSTSRFVKGKPPVPTPVLGKDGKPVTSAASGSGSGSATTSSPRDIIKGSPIAIAITTISKDITRIRKRTFSILLSTPPNGEELALFLRCLLDREQNWITWKQQSCPDFERPPISWASLVSVTSTTTTSTNSANATADNLSSDTATGTKKRKLESVGSKPTSHSVTPSGDIFRRTQTFLADTELESAAKHALNIVSAVPSFELHVQVRKLYSFIYSISFIQIYFVSLLFLYIYLSIYVFIPFIYIELYRCREPG